MNPNCIVFLTLIDVTLSQIHWENLSSIGVFDYGVKDYKLSTPGPNQNLVVKLLPNLQGASSCSQQETENYKRMIRDILIPIKNTIDEIQSALRVYQGEKRFFGVIVATAALGVATAAQITAGMAMENTRINAENIERLKNALKTTNKAVESIRLSQEKTVLAVQGIQDYINKEIVPKVSTLECSVVGLETGLALLRYYSTILTIFGPSLRDPISAKISVQALAQVAGGNIAALMSSLGYSASDLVDAMESGSIYGQIVGVDVDDMIIILNVNYPVITHLEGFQLHELTRISFNQGPEEMVTLVPPYVLTRGYLMSNVDMTGCILTKRSAICSKDQSYPMTGSLQDCLRGNTESCAVSRITGSSVGRFIIYNGNVFANCRAIICRCTDTGAMVAQDSSKLLTYIAEEDCREFVVDGIHVQLGKRKFNPAVYNGTVAVGVVAPVSTLDVSTELGHAMQELNKSKNLLEHSEQILGTMTGLGALWTQGKANAALGVIVIIIIILIGCFFFYKFYKSRRYGSHPHYDEKYRFPSMYGTSNSYVNTIS
ncbi:fusion protein [Gierle apodemus virus]|uniref:Fusion glycoprotein F0 n=1 Tax=Gierle apodemus virus TaxID=2940985 RepID=A0AAE9KY29_9MONO|nr:fusion protein [Gierle apodemus virus]